MNLVLEMQVCIVSTYAARGMASPRVAEEEGPSLPVSISLSGPADHLQSQKIFFSLMFTTSPPPHPPHVTQSLGSLSCRSTETAGIMHMVRPAKPGTSVTIPKVRKEVPPAREAEMMLFSLRTRDLVHCLLG